MKTLLRRIRGSLGLGLAWSVPWAVLGGLLTAVQLFGFAPAVLRTETLLQIVLSAAGFWAGSGFLCGTLFGAALAVAENRGSVDALRGWRVATWGGAAGVVFAGTVLLGALAVGAPTLQASAFVVVFGSGLGAASAAGSLALARAGRGGAAETLAGAAEPGGRPLTAPGPANGPHDVVRS